MRGWYLVVCLLALLGGCGGGLQSLEGLAAVEVASIEVSFGNLPGDRPDVAPFQAAPEDFDMLLGLAQGGTPDAVPPAWGGLARLKIRTRAGNEVVAWLFQTRGAKGAYRVDRTYYRGGSDEAFIRALLECHARVRAKSKAE